jgi:hypothetical protein
VAASVKPTRVPVRPRETEPRRCCEAAGRLGALTNELVDWLGRGRLDEIRINQAKLLLLDRYIAERNGSPAAHRDRVVGEDGQTCVYGQFLTGYHRLHEIEMDRFPPPLSKPVKPKSEPAPAPPQPAGTWFAVEDP